MPRFFFHLFDDLETRDEEGAELPDLEAATAVGFRNARHMAAEQVLQGKLHLRHWIEIADEHGAALLSIPFGSAFEIVA